MASNGNIDGFNTQPLDEDNFGESKALKTVRAFDAFPKTKTSYTQQSSTGGVWTVVLVVVSIWLAGTEFGRWWKGETTHTFDVEAGIGHDLQINFDMIVKMPCDFLNVNVQDASGDRVHAQMALKSDNTTWKQWENYHKGHALGATKEERLLMEHETREYGEQDVHDFLHAARGRRNFRKTPRLPWGADADSCRIAGSMHTTKVQGDFHITAIGHGYAAWAPHLQHDMFNFTHHIMELSFGPFYPALVNPLDDTLASTEHHFHKFQYYLSVVPTVYTTDATALRRLTQKEHESPTSGEDGLRQHIMRYTRNTVFTNQYAVTEQSHPVDERNIPGIFIKYDMEPIMLTIAEEWASIPFLFIRLVNVISGVLVAGGWLYTMTEWAKEVRAKGRRQATSYDGIIGEKPQDHDYSNGAYDKKTGY